MRNFIFVVSIMLITVLAAGCGGRQAETAPSETPTVITSYASATLEPIEASTPSPTLTTKDGFNTYPTDITLNGYANDGLSIADGAIVYILPGSIRDICVIDMQSGEVSIMGMNTDPEIDIGPDDILCLYDGYIYFSTWGYDFVNDCYITGVARVRPDGTDKEMVFESEGLEAFSGCSSYGQYILYHYDADGKQMVYQIDMATGEAIQLEWLSVYGGMAVLDDNGNTYYCTLSLDDNGPSLYRVTMSANGKIPELLVADGSGPNNIVLADDWIYYTSYISKTAKIYRVRKDGSELQELDIIASMYTAFNVAGDYIYYINPEDRNRLYRAKADGTGKEMICDIPNIKWVSISAGRVFIMNSERIIASVMPDGSGFIAIDETLM